MDHDPLDAGECGACGIAGARQLGAACVPPVLAVCGGRAVYDGLVCAVDCGVVGVGVVKMKFNINDKVRVKMSNQTPEEYLRENPKHVVLVCDGKGYVLEASYLYPNFPAPEYTNGLLIGPDVSCSRKRVIEWGPWHIKDSDQVQGSPPPYLIDDPQESMDLPGGQTAYRVIMGRGQALSSARQVVGRPMPDHLPDVPEGYAYAGMGRDHNRRIEIKKCGCNYPNGWFFNSLTGGESAFHYILPIDSPHFDKFDAPETT